MIDFDKELKEFKPMLEVDDIEASIQKDEVKDLMDILQSLADKDKKVSEQ